MPRVISKNLRPALFKARMGRHAWYLTRLFKADLFHMDASMIYEVLTKQPLQSTFKSNATCINELSLLRFRNKNVVPAKGIHSLEEVEFCKPPDLNNFFKHHATHFTLDRFYVTLIQTPWHSLYIKITSWVTQRQILEILSSSYFRTVTYRRFTNYLSWIPKSKSPLTYRGLLQTKPRSRRLKFSGEQRLLGTTPTWISETIEQVWHNLYVEEF